MEYQEFEKAVIKELGAKMGEGYRFHRNRVSKNNGLKLKVATVLARFFMIPMALCVLCLIKSSKICSVMQSTSTSSARELHHPHKSVALIFVPFFRLQSVHELINNPDAFPTLGFI
ncbi:MAG: hypothetical protein RSA52_09715 [Acetivibrio sp.]